MNSVPKSSCGTTLVFLAALILGGCASTGGLHSEATPLSPDALHAQRSLAGVQQDAAAWPHQDWWKAIGDAQLDQLVAEALADNPDMTLVDARVRAALAAAGAAAAARKPTLNGGASSSGARVPPLLPPIASGHFGVINYGYLSFKWNIDLWGGKRAAWQAAVGNARAAAVDAQAARLKLSAAVVQAYFDLGGAYAQRDLTREELQRAEDFLKLTDKRVANGIDSKFSLARIQGEVASDRAHLEAADNTVRTTGMVLAALLGKGPDRALDIQRPALPAIPALAIPGDLPANLLGRRPDVVAARWRVEAATQDVAYAKTLFYPNIDLVATAGYQSLGFDQLLKPGSRLWSLGPAVRLPIFEGGQLRANLRGKNADLDAAIDSYNGTVLDAVREVSDQVSSIQSVARQQVQQREGQEAAEGAYDIAVQRYRAGLGTYLNVLTAENNVLLQRRDAVELAARAIDTQVGLAHALGGGYQAPAETAALSGQERTTP